MTNLRPIKVIAYTIDPAPDDPRIRHGAEPMTLYRPCTCGCDQREDPTLVGYLQGIDGSGEAITIKVYDEAVFKLLDRIMNGHKRPNMLDVSDFTPTSDERVLVQCPNCLFNQKKLPNAESSCDNCGMEQNWTDGTFAGLEGAL